MATELSSELEDSHNYGHKLSSFTQPSKRPSRSPSSEARITIKNRRKRYLDTHPEYSSSPSLELADPLAYDRLVRRFQTPIEREAEGRKKGYSGTLEADLWRSEAKIGALAKPNHAALIRYGRDTSGVIVAEDEDPKNKEEGIQRWRKEMELMFLRGDDADFEYKGVDESEQYDDRGVQEREEEERWFEKENPSWVEERDQDAGRAEGLKGQTGVQDY
ncbi:MAG: hypothetical protein ASARMPRED_003529 [Alectoria sarmentosa]|nr:MAG: hypothetical protein ASARMPRED_003529 [Alectoria sarmentosa]